MKGSTTQWIVAIAGGCLAGAAFAAATQSGELPPPAAAERTAAAHARLPLAFEPVAGAGERDPRYTARGPGYAILLAANEVVMQRAGAEDSAVRMRLLGASPRPAGSGIDRLPGTSNYFIGSDPQQWRRDVPNYAKVEYRGVYPGVDVVWYGNGRQLEYDFVVAPRADPRRIALAFDGVSAASIDAEGNLVLATAAGTLVQQQPIAWQEIDGLRHPVDARYVLRGKRQAGFVVAQYDRARPLVIDPALAFSTYLSGSGEATGLAIAVDPSGSAYVAGYTSPPYPTGPVAIQAGYGGGNSDVFVTKLNAAGTAVVYSTYLGGAGSDYPAGIAVDANGSAYVAGYTSGPFPTTPGAIRTAYAGNSFDGFVARLNAAGSALVYSTYIGTSSSDEVNAIAIDADGNAYITGTTGFDFPTTPGAYRGPSDLHSSGFLAKLNPSGTAFVYSTFLSGGVGSGIALDAARNAFVTGFTFGGNDLAVTPGAYQSAPNGDYDGFVCRFNATGTAAFYCTYVGGATADTPAAIAIDPAGNAYIAGSTGGGFPVTAGAVQGTYAGGTSDGFVAKLNPTGTTLVYATYFGGAGYDYASDIVVDAGGNAHVTGLVAGGQPMPVDPSGYVLEGSVFVAGFGPAGALLYATDFGSAIGARGEGLAIDAAGSLYVTGDAIRTGFGPLPTTPGAYQTALAGTTGAFVVKLVAGAGAVVPNYQGLWWRSPAGSESGWGINFSHQGDLVFATWFTYDTERNPLWLAAVLEEIAPGVYTGGAFTTTGPPFNAVPWDPAQVVETTVGAITVAFSDTDHGTLTYTAFGVTQTKPIVRQRFARPVASCYFGALADPSKAIGYQGLWWKFPAGSESGWGANFTQQGSIIFVTWYTYGADGKPLWLIAVAEYQGDGAWSGPISTVTGPPFSAQPWDPSTVVETVIGTLTITFADGNHATFAYTVNGVTQAKAITRQTFVEPGTVCQ